MSTTFQPPKIVTATLAAGASKSFPITGTFARVISATGELRIGFDLGTPVNSALGRWYQTFGDEIFSQIVVENPGGNLLSFEIEVSRRMISGDDRLNVVGDRIGSLAQDGTDGNGIVPPAGAVGIRGWLSGIYNALSGGTININATGIATEVTLTALKARADLLATEAKLEQVRALLAGTVNVAGPLTNTQLRASAVPVSGPLTDAQLRATAVPVSIAATVAVAQVGQSLFDVADVGIANAAVTKVLDVAVPHKTVTITNKGAAEIRVGSASVAANRGQPVAVGGSITIPTSDSVWVYNPGAFFNAPVSYTN